MTASETELYKRLTGEGRDILIKRLVRYRYALIEISKLIDCGSNEKTIAEKALSEVHDDVVG